MYVSSSWRSNTMRCADPVLFLSSFAALLESMWTPDYIQLRVYDTYNTSSSNGSFTCGGNDTRSEAEKEAQSEASDWLLYFNLAYYLPAVMVTLLIGGWSDKYGRRPLMVMPLVGGAIEAINFLVVMRWNLSLEYLFIGKAVEGLTGGWTTMLMSVFSYAADMSVHSNRTWRLGVLESMIFVGGCLGQLLGGVLVQHVSPFAVEGVALGCYIISILYVALFIVESVPSKSNMKINIETKPENGNVNGDIDHLSSDRRSCIQIQTVTAAIQIFTKHHTSRPRWHLVAILAVFGVYTVVVLGSGDVQYLYLLGRPLCWSPSEIGYFLSLRLATFGIAACFLLPLLSKRLHLRDTTIILLSLVSMVGSFILETFAYNTWIMFLVPIVGILGGLTHPTMRAMMSKLIGKHNQGALFSIVASVETACTLSATSMFNPLFAVTNDSDIQFLPSSGAVSFLVMSALLFIPVTLTLILYCVKADLDNQVYFRIKSGYSDVHKAEK